MLGPLALLLVAVGAQAALMPLPTKVVAGDGRFVIDSSFSVSGSGCPGSALARFRSRVSSQTGIALIGGGAGLEVVCRQPAPDFPALGEDESYTLDISPDGARLDAATGTGALRGLETFSQLIVPGPDGFEAPAIHIEDRPRFPWRGLMLDVSRHWMPPAIVKRNLDAMAAVKLNVFHWHLSDDQGFRVESKLFPQLQQMGSDGNFYTQREIREIVAYARDRGIRVVAEFDMPGHTTSWFVGMPQLAAAPGAYGIERTWGVFPAVMAMAREDTYTFLDAFLGEMAELFPDPYFHIGGDEVADPSAQSMQPAFNLRLQALLAKHGKTMVGWEEAMAPGVTTDAIAQAWRGPDSLAAAVGRGYRGILSYGYYLNYLQPASTHYAADPGDAPGVLGGEACMWAEYVDAETVDSRIWPRMAAVAERFWSPQETNDENSMYERLDAVSRWLEWTGVKPRANYLPMLERLAGEQPVEPLRILADACEAGGPDVRSQAGPYTSFTPLNRLVDAARPESELVRRMELAVAAGDLGTLQAQFQQWQGNHLAFEAMAAGNSLLAEALPLSTNLASAGEIGLRALAYWAAGETLPQDWLVQQEAALDAMEQPVAEVILAAVRPVRLLLDALSGGPPPQLRQLPNRRRGDLPR